MPLRFYEGVEGSGKTCMMTRDAYMHYLSGGEVYAFPGYELKEKTGEILSKPFMPQDMVSFSDFLKKRHILIIFDEVTNWINNHNWQNKFADLCAAVMSQRRKLEVAVWMTGPIFYRLPPIVQEMIHETVHCVDLHTLNHKWPRGEYCRYQKEDMRGLLSNPKHRFSRRKRFHMRPWYPYYETDMITEFVNQFMRLKFKGREIIVGPDGKIVNNIDDYEYQQSYREPVEVTVACKIQELREGGKRKFTNTDVHGLVREMGLNFTDKIKRLLRSHGFDWDNKKQIWTLSNTPSPT